MQRIIELMTLHYNLRIRNKLINFRRTQIQVSKCCLRVNNFRATLKIQEEDRDINLLGSIANTHR